MATGFSILAYIGPGVGGSGRPFGVSTMELMVAIVTFSVGAVVVFACSSSRKSGK